MNSDKNIPRSFAQWDSAAKVGLAAIAAVLLLFLALLIGAASKGGEKDTSSGIIPGDAANVGLPEGKLAEVEAMLAPLLRGELSAFDGADDISSGDAVSALLSHLCLTRSYATNEDGAYIVPADEVGELYSSLFGVAPPRGDIDNVAVYDAADDVYAFSGSDYHEEYEVSIISTHTLDDVVYVNVEVKAPSVPISSEQSPESVEPVESVASDDVSTEGTVTDETVTDTGSEPDSEISSEDASSEPEDISYVTLRKVIFTLKYTGNTYIITELRDV